MRRRDNVIRALGPALAISAAVTVCGLAFLAKSFSDGRTPEAAPLELAPEFLERTGPPSPPPGCSHGIDDPTCFHVR